MAREFLRRGLAGGFDGGADPSNAPAFDRQSRIFEAAIRFSARGHGRNACAGPHLIPLFARRLLQLISRGCLYTRMIRQEVVPYTGIARMNRYHLKSVLLSRGWARDAIVGVSDEGVITEIDDAPADGPAGGRPGNPETERFDGIVVPGMSNAHSHAFQRGMAGNTEYRSSARDSFWTWRSAMYALANRIDPDDLQILATQRFVEMLRSGYTSVAEFHYLHRQKDGAPYPAANSLWDAIGNAASIAGIGLTFLPTLYQTSDFGGQPLKAEQARFASDTDAFLRAVENRIDAERRGRSPSGGAGPQRTGVAFH